MFVFSMIYFCVIFARLYLYVLVDDLGQRQRFQLLTHAWCDGAFGPALLGCYYVHAAGSVGLIGEHM